MPAVGLNSPATNKRIDVRIVEQWVVPLKAAPTRIIPTQALTACVVGMLAGSRLKLSVFRLWKNYEL